MASGDLNILYKYQSMRTKWYRSFEESNPGVADFIKTFFDRFYRDHRNFTFVVGELSDGLRHLLVEPAKYQQIKEEIEEEIDPILPDVAQIREATIITRSKSFQNAQSFRKYCKTLSDHNLAFEERRRRGAKKSVQRLQQTLRTVPEALILAFDFEVYEHDHSIVLEIGYALGKLNKPKETIQSFHYIIEENQSYKNKDKVPDNRDGFRFGTSEVMSLQRAAGKIQEHIHEADFLVTHSDAHDQEFLASCGVSVSDKPMFDTQILAMAKLPEGPLFYSLRNLLTDLEIRFQRGTLHNSGNDAFYTMKAFLALTDGLH